MANPKTIPNKAKVGDFLARLDPDRRKDCKALAKIMRNATDSNAKMWGTAIVGFGHYHYRYASGREGDFFLAVFSPRRKNLTVYLADGFDLYGPLMKKLGRYTTGKSCLYLKRLSDVDLATLETLISRSAKATQKRYP